MTRFFSIIIPVYNVAPWLRECLDSVLNQTYGNWEAICVDDGSTDDSPKILDEYAARDSRFRVIHKENGGVSSARNAALDVATGEWIMFLDGDDVINEGSLEILSSYIADDNAIEMVMFKTVSYHDGDVLIFPKENRKSDRIDVSQEINDEELLVYFAGKIYLRERIGILRFKGYAHGEDRLFLLEYLMNISNVAEIDEYIYGYRYRIGSATNSALKLRHFSDTIGYSIDMLDVVERMNKCVLPVFYSTIAAYIFDRYVFEMKDLSREDRNVAWEFWQKHLEHFIRVKNFPVVYRLMLPICGAIKSWYVALTLCIALKSVKKVRRIIKGCFQ